MSEIEASNKIHRPWVVLVGSMFFGPVAGGLLTGLDYRRYGKKAWWIIAFIPTVILVVVLSMFTYLLPNIQIPSSIIPITYSAIYYALQVQLDQQRETKSYRSLWAGLGWGILGLFVYVFISFLITIPLWYDVYVFAIENNLSADEVVDLLLNQY